MIAVTTVTAAALGVVMWFGQGVVPRVLAVIGAWVGYSLGKPNGLVRVMGLERRMSLVILLGFAGLFAGNAIPYLQAGNLEPAIACIGVAVLTGWAVARETVIYRRKDDHSAI